jgi:nitrogen fixation NifU-like protein
VSELADLYQEVILDHNRNPRNRGELQDANRSAKSYNPLCGDEVSVYAKVTGGVLEDVSFDGCGCAISIASASMMTEAVKGMEVSEALQAIEGFRRGMTEDGSQIEGPDELLALEGVKEFPMRVKCATLAWHTLANALKEAS